MEVQCPGPMQGLRLAGSSEFYRGCRSEMIFGSRFGGRIRVTRAKLKLVVQRRS
jgi:hypothetical protein